MSQICEVDLTTLCVLCCGALSLSVTPQGKAILPLKVLLKEKVTFSPLERRLQHGILSRRSTLCAVEFTFDGSVQSRV